MHYISFQPVAACVHLLIYFINSDPPLIWKTKFHTHVKQQVNHINWMRMANGPEKATHFIVTNIVTVLLQKYYPYGPTAHLSESASLWVLSLASHYLCHKHWSHDSAHLDILSTFIAYTDINTFKTGVEMHLVIWQLKPRNFCLYWHIFKKQQFIFHIFFPVALGPKWAMASSFLRFLDHTRWCTTAASVMSQWHIHCVHMADHRCIVALSRSRFWIPILGHLNPC
jgi:hypothetical protein